MALIDDIRAQVREISVERSMTDDHAFGYWFLEGIEDFSQEGADDTITGGPWDQGRDAVYDDDEARSKTIYQFKFSEDLAYVRGAFTDIQRGVIAERDNLPRFDALYLTIVTIATAGQDLEREKSRVERSVKRWLTANGYRLQLILELVDLKRFLEISERIYGVDLNLGWRQTIIDRDVSILGLVNALGLKDHIDKDELFSFNIRRFLGIRKGSVSYKIRQSLEDEEKRERFWILNNGIVCLCTKFRPTGERVEFENFTIVNGAQTINTISRFLDENPTSTDPIWVVAKVLKVEESDIKSAAELTEASNTQNSTSSRDIRATDIAHPRILAWLRREFELDYVYKRGGRASSEAIRMKELAQAYVSFWRQEPNISFARPGQIFKENKYYEDVFPPSRLDELSRTGGSTEIRKFLLERLISWKIMNETRQFLRDNTGVGKRYDKKYRSMTYHMTWLYNPILQDSLDNLDLVYQRIDRILAASLNTLFEKAHDYLEDVEVVIPRDLKSDIGTKKLGGFVAKPRFQEIKTGVQRELV